jgi:hypothetical protein
MSSDYNFNGLDDPLVNFNGLDDPLDNFNDLSIDDYNNPLEQIILKVGKDKLTISKRAARLSTFLESVLIDSTVTEIDIKRGDLATLNLVVEFLEEYKGEPPRESLPKPLPSADLEENLKKIMQGPLTKWTADFFKKLSNDNLLKVIELANYMDIQPLLEIGLAKYALNVRKQLSDLAAIERNTKKNEKERNEARQKREDILLGLDGKRSSSSSSSSSSNHSYSSSSSSSSSVKHPNNLKYTNTTTTTPTTTTAYNDDEKYNLLEVND